MLPLRRLKGPTPRFTHYRMRRSPKKQKSTPVRLALLRSRSYPFRAPHPLPQRTNALRPPPPGAPNARRSGYPLPHIGEIHGAGARSTRLRARSMEVARRCCRGVSGSPPPRRSALPTPLAAPSLTLAVELPPHPTAMAFLTPHPPRRHRAKPGTGGVGGGGARALSLASGSDPNGWKRPT
jgi:hypothetical protein